MGIYNLEFVVKMRQLLISGLFILISFSLVSHTMGAEKKKNKKKKSKEELERDAERDARLKKRDIRDYSDDDIHRLLEQWEEDDEPIPPDELPDGHPDKPPPAMDFSKVDMTNPENVMAASKKGQSVMLFVDIQGISDPEMAEEMSSLWQTGLANNHVPCERMMVEDFQAMFFFRDGVMLGRQRISSLSRRRCSK